MKYQVCYGLYETKYADFEQFDLALAFARKMDAECGKHSHHSVSLYGANRDDGYDGLTEDERNEWRG